MRLHEGPDDGKSQLVPSDRPRSIRVAAHEGFEDARRGFRRDAGSLVRDAQDHGPGFWPQTDRDGPARGIAPCIGDERQENLPKTCRIDLDDKIAEVEFDGKPCGPQFRAIVLRANPDGSTLTLGDVAKVEVGPQSMSFSIFDGGKPATAAAIQLAPGANTVSTSEAVRSRLLELAPSMPAGVAYAVSYDTAPFAKLSITQVVHTLLEAMALVFLIMLMFLQNVRYTLIPAIVAPIALLGTFAVTYAIGCWSTA